MVCGKDLGSGFLINLEKLTQAFLKFLYLKFSTAPLNVLCCFEGTGVNRPLPFSQRYQDQPDEDIADDYEEALGRLQLSFYFRNQCAVTFFALFFCYVIIFCQCLHNARIVHHPGFRGSGGIRPLSPSQRDLEVADADTDVEDDREAQGLL